MLHNTTEIDIIVGKNLRQRRSAKGMTQAELGGALPEPVSAQQISKYEAGEDGIGAHRLVDLAAALRCPITALFDGVKSAAESIEARHTMVAMHNYSALPKDVQEALRVLMRAMSIALGAKLKTVEGR